MWFLCVSTDRRVDVVRHREPRFCGKIKACVGRILRNLREHLRMVQISLQSCSKDRDKSLSINLCFPMSFEPFVVHYSNPQFDSDLGCHRLTMGYVCRSSGRTPALLVLGTLGRKGCFYEENRLTHTFSKLPHPLWHCHTRCVAPSPPRGHNPAVMARGRIFN